MVKESFHLTSTHLFSLDPQILLKLDFLSVFLILLNFFIRIIYIIYIFLKDFYLTRSFSFGKILAIFGYGVQAVHLTNKATRLQHLAKQPNIRHHLRLSIY